MPNASGIQSSYLLKTKGSQIVNESDQIVILRGFGLGGWMNMENFITGFPSTESAQRQAILEVLGEDKYDLFFDRFLEYFFLEEDAQFIQSLGLNCLRLPINYRHIEDDLKPFIIKEEGFKHLDRVIDLCAKHNIYTIIDLHALPGYQNQDWHCDNPTHQAFFWHHKHFQDRSVNLWEVIADRYKENPWVAGYNLINEPADPTEKMIMPVYQRLVDAIRSIDTNHIIFLEGNCYSRDFHMFGNPWPNIVYTIHDYAPPGFIDGGPYPGVTGGQYFDKEVLEQSFESKIQYMLKHQVPIWVGEFGPVYRGESLSDAMCYCLLMDQLDIYTHYGASWSIWTYKDIGLQGVVYVAPDSLWMQRIRPFAEKKARLGVDAWGGKDTHIRNIMEPIEQTFTTEFPRYSPFPFGAQWQVDRLVRHILLAESLLPEFAECFRGIREEQIDILMRSFHFNNCEHRQKLATILSDYSRR